MNSMIRADKQNALRSAILSIFKDEFPRDVLDRGDTVEFTVPVSIETARGFELQQQGYDLYICTLTIKKEDTK